MLSLRCVAISCLVAIVAASVHAMDLERIVGGHTINIDQAPYAVQFRYANGQLFCGGTLVSPQFVVTAAHCFPSGQGGNVVVVGGVTTINGNGEERRITRVVLHPEYTSKTMHSDVAVIKLDKPLSGAHIKPIRLCSRALNEGDALQVSGWGRTSDSGPMSHELRSVMLPVASRKMCDKQYGIFVSKNMFCGSGVEVKGHCFGDSGGPAVYNGELCGINSFGHTCGSVGKTVGFTDVYQVSAFIKKVMAN